MKEQNSSKCSQVHLSLFIVDSGFNACEMFTMKNCRCLAHMVEGSTFVTVGMSMLSYQGFHGCTRNLYYIGIYLGSCTQ